MILFRLQASERELKDKDRRLLSAEAQVSDLQARLTDAVNQRKHWENEYSVSSWNCTKSFDLTIVQYRRA